MRCKQRKPKSEPNSSTLPLALILTLTLNLARTTKYNCVQLVQNEVDLAYGLASRALRQAGAGQPRGLQGKGSPMKGSPMKGSPIKGTGTPVNGSATRGSPARLL